jgi:tRNA pseudouridine38-40 synthase
LGQVATLQLPKDIDEKEAFLNFNKALPATIEITNLQQVESDFHARSSAIGKCYHYQIWNDLDMPEELQGKVWYIPEELDVERMIDACSLFVGTMDYASFAKVPNYNRSTTIKTIYSLVLRMDEPLLDFSIIGNSFLYKMVRNIIRAIVKVGERRTSLEELSHIIEARTRQASPGTAPASGLYLDSVFYDQASLNNAISEEKESEGEQRDE